jgi:hypothetical protein
MIITKGGAMSKNTKQTSAQIARLAAETLQDKQASQIAKSLAASALAQVSGGKQTGAAMEEKAARVLSSEHSADLTKQLAASVLAQSNKER